MTDKTLADDLRERGLSNHVIKLLVDYGVDNANEIAFFTEDNFKELRSKGLRDFQETHLKHIMKQLQPAVPEKTNQEGASCMKNMDSANRNISANTINTVNLSDHASDKDDEAAPTFMECAERQILERLKSSLKDVAKRIDHICTEYTRLDKVTVDPHTWDQLFRIMEEKKRLLPRDVVFLQILLWKVEENPLFQLITTTADEWNKTFGMEIVFLKTDPDVKGLEKVKFHLCVTKADFPEDEQRRWISGIAFLLMVDMKHIEIENLEFGGSAWVTVTMPAVLSEALQQKCQDLSFQRDLSALSVDRISFMTSSGAEQTVYISVAMDTSDHEDYKYSAKASQSDMDVPTAESGLSGAAVDPSPVHWKEDATRQLLKLFLSIAAAICLQADLQPFIPAVTEAITMALTSVDRRVREYAELCAHHVQSNTKPDVQTTSSLFLKNERSIRFYVEERLSVWKKQSQDVLDWQPPVFEGLHVDVADDVHLQALDQCFPTLVRDMRAKGTTLVDDLVADDVISVTSATSILNKTTDRQINVEVLKAVRGMSAQQFHTTFLPALQREGGNALLARQLTSTIRRLQEDARSQSQRACGVCVLRDRVDPRRVADQLLAGGLIPRGLYDDLRAKTLSTDEAWEIIFLHVGHTAKLMPILSKKYPGVHAEMLEKGISSLECRCRRLSRGLVEVVQARSEGDDTDVARLSDFTSLLQPDKLPLPEYRMMSFKRGCCFLVVNTLYRDLQLSNFSLETFQKSHAALRDLFRRLGFDLIERENLSASRLMEEARKVAHMDHSASDCLAVVLLTRHGPRDSLHCSDGADVTVEKVKEVFTASRCPSLAGKPKLLYRPFARGRSLPSGVTRSDEEGSTEAAPDHADFLVIETAPTECVTGVNGDTNVLSHVELLAAVLERHGHNTDFVSCLALVNNQMCKMRSKYGAFHTAPFHSTLRKQLKFPLLK